MNNHDLFLVIMTVTGVLMMMIGIGNVVFRRDQKKKLPNYWREKCERELLSDYQLQSKLETPFAHGICDLLDHPPDYDSAVERFLKSLENDQGDVRLFLGFAMWKKGSADFRASIAHLQKVPENNPNKAAAWFFGGVLHVELGEPDLSIECFSKVISRDLGLKTTYTLAALSERGRAYQEKREFKKAKADFEKVITQGDKTVDQDQLAECNFQIGKTDIEQQDDDKGIKSFKLCLDINPKHDLCHHELGKVHFAKGNLEDAEANHEEAVKYGKKRSEYHGELGRVRIDMKRPVPAISALTKAIRLDKRSVEWRRLRGIAYLQQGKTKNARNDLEEADLLEGQSSVSSPPPRASSGPEPPTPTSGATPQPTSDGRDSTTERAA